MADAGRAYTGQVKEFFSDIAFILTLAWQAHKSLVVGLGLVRTVGAVVPSVQVYIGKLIVDHLVLLVQDRSTQALHDVLFYVAIEIGLLVVSQILSSITAALEDVLGEGFPYTILGRILRHTTTLDLSYFENPIFRDKIEAVDREMTWRAKGMLTVIYGLGSEIISLIAFAVVLFKIGWVYVAILAATMLPVILIEFRQSIVTYRWQTSWSRWWRHAWYYRWVLAAYDYIQEFRVFRLNPLFVNRYLDIGKRYITAYRSHSLRMQRLHFLKNMLANIIGYYGGLILLLFQALSRQITIGDVTMYMSAYRSALGSLSALVKTIADIYSNHLFIQDLRGILLYEPCIRRSPQAQIIEKDTPLSIEFEHVWFRYREEGPWVLSDVSFRLDAGVRMALVGDNGSGKTTLVKLLLRFYDPTKGRLLLNGIDLREIDLDSYYARIGVIFQQFAQYEGRIREQIGYGEIESMEDLEQSRNAARISGAAPFIEELPKQYETPLGNWELEEGTVKLSGGQWQRLALARACMKQQAALLILDEPSAALDPEAEELFFEQLMREIQGKSIIFISHRFSTVRRADKILALRHGRIDEHGTHEELMQRNGRYAELFRMQARWYE
jgi:ABC-type multidrug transport system fused ATPase/permease subunit